MSRRKVITNEPLGLCNFQTTNSDPVGLGSVPDDASNTPFVPAVLSNWSAPPPTTVAAALNDLPAKISKWKTLYSVDFTAQADLNLSIDGIYQINGVDVLKQGSAYGSVIVPNAIVHGAGLTLWPNAGASDHPRSQNTHRPSLRFYLNALLGAQWPHSRPLRMTVVLNYPGSIHTPNGGNSYAALLAQGNANGRMGPIFYLTQSGDAVVNVTTMAAPPGNYSLNANTNAIYLPMRVLHIELPQGAQGPMVFRGAVGPEIPAIDSPDWIECGTVGTWDSVSTSTYILDPTAGNMSKFAIELGAWDGGYEQPSLRTPYFTSLLVEQYS
jgi:hypothetical protein